MIAVVRSPIELWQRARILVAVYLYQVKVCHRATELDSRLIQNENKRQLVSGHTPETIPRVDSRRSLEGIEKSHRVRQPLQHRDIKANQTIVCGFITLQQISLDSSQEYRCVDYYDVGQGYFLMCNIADVSDLNGNTHLSATREANPASKRLLIGEHIESGVDLWNRSHRQGNVDFRAREESNVPTVVGLEDRFTRESPRFPSRASSSSKSSQWSSISAIRLSIWGSASDLHSYLSVDTCRDEYQSAVLVDDPLRWRVSKGNVSLETTDFRPGLQHAVCPWSSDTADR